MNGRFTTVDPIGLLGGTNNYEYAPNPLTWIDPLGLSCKENSWNKFQSQHKGEYANSTEASKAYKKINNARLRQQQMLENNVGFNLSPTAWDKYPTIGRNGTFISDKQGITDIIGDFSGQTKMTLDKSQVLQLEEAFGLERGTLQSGFKVRQVDNIVDRMPRSPLEGNQYFLGAGNHLPGGAPEMVIDSIPTADTKGVTTLIEITTK